MVDEPTFTLADDAIAALGNPRRSLTGHHFKTPQAKKALRQSQSFIRSARKFVLDDELTRFAAQMATMITPEQTLSMIHNYVRCPYEHCFIEWNEKLRVKTINETVVAHPDHFPGTIKSAVRALEKGGLDDIVDRCGYHIWDVSEGDPMNCGDISTGPQLAATCYFAHGFESGLAVSPTGFCIKLDRPFSFDELRMKTANFLGRMPTREEVEEHKTSMLHGAICAMSQWWVLPNVFGPEEVGVNSENFTRVDQQKVLDELLGNKSNVLVSQVLSHVHTIQTNSIHWYTDTSRGYNWSAHEKITQHGLECIEGDPRFILTVLALLNHDWVLRGESQRMTGSRRRNGARVRGNAYHVISISLPKNRGIDVVMKNFGDGESRRRYHEVRGHWMYIKASGKRVWRKSCHRGDPKLGVVTHDYELTGGDNAWKGSKGVKDEAA
tara:strand:- start:876 stop:2189 length:1314 start_codon:yes stop_codon:yes gene_type:complete